MITGEIKNKIDAIGDTFWTGGITNSIYVSSFIGSNVLSSMQEEYLKTIITDVSSNGDITPATLLSKALFDAYKWQAVFGQNLICVKQFVDKLHNSIVA